LTAVPAPAAAVEPAGLRDQWRAAAAAIVLFLVAASLARGGLFTSLHPGDVGHYETFGRRFREGLFPYGAGFYFEYPPFALPVFVLPELISPAHYLAIFKLMMVLCSIGTILATTATLARLRVPEEKTIPLLAVVSLSPLLLGSTYLNRYDPWAVMLTSLALLALISQRARTGAALLALAFAAKTYPAAIAPVAAIWVYRTEGKRRLLESTAVFAGTVLIVFGPFVVRAFGGLGNSYYTQAKRSLQIESTGASVLLVADKLGLYSIHWFRGMSVDLAGRVADVVGTLTSLAQVASILLVAWIYLKSGRRDAQSFLVASAAAVFAFVAFNKVFSQQFAVWLVPFAPLVYGSVVLWASLLVAAILLLTNVDTVWGDWGLRNVDWTIWAVAARNVAVIAGLVVLARELWRRRGLESSV
jgi:uncharacterized membrane protein